jgi:hypothetical protein
MHIPRCLHIAQYILLQLCYRLQGVGHILILLDVTYNFSSLRTFGEIDQRRLLDDRWDTIFDERKIREIDTYSHEI